MAENVSEIGSSSSSNFIDMKGSIQTHMSGTLKDSKIVT